MKLILWLIRLYPRLWRERYEEEMLALLEQHHVTLATLVDITLGALDAHLDPHYRSNKSLFSTQSLHSLAMFFITTLSLATFTAFLWGQETRDAVFATPGSSSDTMAGFFNGESLLLLIIVFCIMGNSMRKAWAARKKGTLIAAIACVVLSCLFAALSSINLFSPFFSANPLIRIILLVSNVTWVLLTINGLYTLFVKVKEAIEEHRTRLLLLASFVTLLLPLCLMIFPHPNFLLVTGTTPDNYSGISLLGSARLTPFIGLGSALLALGTNDVRKAKSHHLLLLPATLLMLQVLMIPVQMFLWYLSLWSGEKLFLLASPLHPIQFQGAWWFSNALAATVIATLIASIAMLIALIRGYTIITSKYNAAQTMEEPPLQERHIL